MPLAQPSLDLLPVFNAQPGATLLLSPDWVIVGASDDYLAATLTERAALVGQFIFDAFPDNPAAPEANGMANVRASLAQVLATRQPHRMAPQHYDVPDPARPGYFVERHWQPRHTPVLDAAGQVQFIIQSVQDITASRRAERQLRESQAAEQAARAEAETQRQRLFHILKNFPAVVASYRGPEHIFELVSHRFQQDFPTRTIKGLPVREALPELEGQGYYDILDGVYHTGEPFYGTEIETWVDLTNTGKLELQYYNVCFQATRDVQGRIDGILNFAYDVTDAVLARRQVQQLNQELEARAQVRAQELLQAHAETDTQRQRLHQLVAEAPALIASLRGPAHVVELANEGFRAIFGGRELVGKPYRQAVPELAGQPFFSLLDEVYRTGETYYGIDQPVTLDRTNSGRLEDVFVTYIYQATRDAQGQMDGILIFAYEVTEQVLARQERVAQQEQLHALFMQAPAPIVILDGPELVYQLVNPAYQQIFPGRALLGKPLLEALPELAGSPIPAILEAVYRTGETFTAQELPLELARREGGPLETMYWTFTYQARRNAQGVIDGALVFAAEVTAQVQARQQVEQANLALEARVAARTHELREAQATAERERTLLQALLTQAPVAIGLFEGEEVRVSALNPMMADLFGHSVAELLGKPMLEGAPEMRGQGFAELMWQVQTTRVPFIGQEMPASVMRNGELTLTYYNFVYQPFYDTQGQVLGVIDVAVEVTEQVLARRQMEQLNQELETRVAARTRELEAARTSTEQQRRRLSEVFEQAPVAICVFAGPAYVLEVVNPPMGEMLGQPTPQLVGRPFFDALPELKDQGLRELLDQVRQTGAPYYAQEQEIHLARHGAGRSGYYNFTYQPLRDSKGQVTAVTCVATDVSEQVRARRQVQNLNEELAAINEEMTATNEELHESNAQLLRTNADLDTFVYAASHDLKAPIANIEGLLGALREYLPPLEQEPMVPRLLGMMEDAIGRFQQTVAHLTDVTRLQAGAEPITDGVDVPAILEDVRLDIVPLLESTHTQLLLAVPACPGVRVPAKHLRSILFNLLSNAVKYRAPDRAPLVQVRTHCTASRFVLEVQDNGLGLSEAQQEQLFTMFRRLHTHVEGSGVGLYLIRRMIELARGTITVASQPGEGSTFTVTLLRA